METRPFIVVVGDEGPAVEELRQPLERRFGADYRVVAHASPAEALTSLEAHARRGDEVALILAYQVMAELPGRELLGRAHLLVPRAKRGLVVPWGFRGSARDILEGCAFGQLDNYLLTPFVPVEVHLYPVVNEFLAEWTRENRPPLEIVRIVANERSPRAYLFRELLERNGISFGHYPADSELGRRLVEQHGLHEGDLPALFVHDGQLLRNPSPLQLAQALGVTGLVQHQHRSCDLAIVGAGPAGLAAAVYAASEGLRTLVIEREAIGGQAGTSALIRNYLGFPRGISGADLALRAYQQAWLFGAKYVFAREVVRLQAVGTQRILTLSDGRDVTAKAVLITTGASYRRLGVPSVERFTGAGLYYSSVGAMPHLLHGRDVCVVGAGNSAGQAAVHLSRQARTVFLLVRGPSLHERMSDYLVQEIRHTPNIEVRLDTDIVGGDGEESLTRIVVRHRPSGSEETLTTEAVFALIGARPHTQWLAGTVRRDAHGFLLTGRHLADLEPPGTWGGRPPLRLETSVPGVFAAGDVRFDSAKRVASAVGEGAVAVQLIHDYLAEPVAVGDAPTLPPLGAEPEAHPVA